MDINGELEEALNYFQETLLILEQIDALEILYVNDYIEDLKFRL